MNKENQPNDPLNQLINNVNKNMSKMHITKKSKLQKKASFDNASLILQAARYHAMSSELNLPNTTPTMNQDELNALSRTLPQNDNSIPWKELLTTIKTMKSLKSVLRHTFMYWKEHNLCGQVNFDELLVLTILQLCNNEKYEHIKLNYGSLLQNQPDDPIIKWIFSGNRLRSMYHSSLYWDRIKNKRAE